MIIKQVGNKEGLIPSGVKDVNDDNNYWLLGHSYEVPNKFIVNPDIFEIVETKKEIKKIKEKDND